MTNTDSSSADRSFEAPDLIEVMDAAVRYNRFLIEELASWASGAPRLLDFGAGNGRFSRAMLDAGHEMYAVEPDAELREGFADCGVEARPSLAAFGSGQQFDGIYTVNVLEHVDDDVGLLRGFFERLAPGGRLFVYVPAFAVLYSANDARVGHLRRYRREGLVRIVRAAGFQVSSARYVDSIGFVAGLAYRFFGNRDGGLAVGAVRLYDSFVFPLSRAIDSVAQRFFGKNLLLSAIRPFEQQVHEEPTA